MRAKCCAAVAGSLQEAQRDPAGGEFLLGLVDIARGQGGVARDQIGGAVLADVEHLARQQPPLDPPFVDIVEPGRIPRRAQHQLRGLGEFLFAAQQLDLAEDVAGIAMQFARNGLEQCAWCWRPCDRPRCAPSPARPRRCRAAWRRAARPRARCRRAEDPSAPSDRPASASAPNRSSAAFSVSSDIVSLRQASRTRRSRIGAVAARDHRLRQRELAFGRQRRFVFEPRQTVASSRWSSHSAASRRRRRKVCEGQLGLAAMKAR